MEAVLEALSDPQRRKIYRQIADEPWIVCSKIAPELPRSTVSVQLRRLREAGLIAQQRQGQLIANNVREDGAWQRFRPLLETIFATLEEEANGAKA